MDKKSHKKTGPHQIDLVIEALANFVSENPEEASDFLQEKGIDVDAFMKEDIAFIKKLHADALLSEGEQRQTWISQMKEKFMKLLEESPEQAKVELSNLSIPVNFSKLDTEGLDEAEIKKLFENAQFLNYLDTKFPDDDDPSE